MLNGPFFDEVESESVEEVKIKKCTGKCGQIKPLSEFGNNKRNSDGLKGKCKECEKLYNQKRNNLPVSGKSALKYYTKLINKGFTGVDIDSEGFIIFICKDCMESFKPNLNLVVSKLDHDTKSFLCDECKVIRKCNDKGERLCTGECKQWKPISEFGIDTRRNDGLICWCNECIKKYKNEYYEKHRDERKISDKKYYEENREKVLEYHKEYYEENKEVLLEKIKEYKNSPVSGELALKKQEELFADITEIDSEGFLIVQCSHTNCVEWFRPTSQMIQHRIEATNSHNRGECRLFCSDECKDTCEAHRYFVTKEDMLMDVPDTEVMKQSTRKAVLERDEYKCIQCGEDDITKLHCHHLDPQKIYPDLVNELENIHTYCQTCHNIIHAADKGVCSLSYLRNYKRPDSENTSSDSPPTS